MAAAALLASSGARAEGTLTGTRGYAGARAVENAFDKEKIPPGKEAPAGPRATAPLRPGEAIWIQTGKSRIVQLPRPIKRVSIGDPELAGVVVLGPQTVMINGKELPRDLGRQTQSRGVSGTLSQLLTRTLTPPPRYKETTFAVWFGRDDVPDVHTVVVADFVNQQVLLEVTVAELDRSKIEEWGIDFRAARNSFFLAYFQGGGIGPSPQESASLVPSLGQALLPLGTTDSAPTFAFALPKDDIQGLIQALERRGLIKILAQPRLVALSGQNALFQVGGEIPIRIATGFATDVEFKPFGTIVNFVPQIAEEGDIVLTVTPEVSQPDFNSLVEGIPTFRTRRVSTSTRLRNGQTLVIGGLMQTLLRKNVSGVPYLMDVPVLGWVFRQERYEEDVTELLVVVTPAFVTPIAPGVTVPLPTDRVRRPAPDPMMGNFGASTTEAAPLE